MSQAPSLVRFVLEVQDMPRAQAFYGEAFGATVKGSGDFTILELGGRTVNLSVGGRGPADTGLGLEVDDLPQACDAVERAGGRVLRPVRKDYTGNFGHDEFEWLAIVTDTEGNRFCLVSTGGCYYHPSAFAR